MKIEFSPTCLCLDGRPGYLVSGELHYFRVPRRDWRERMLRLKAAGARALSTYLPWSIHEPEEGRFVFDAGDGVTDVSAFLEIAAQEGLAVIAKPGPYSYSELVNNGLPAWLLQGYPEILARNSRGQVISYSGVSYLHPLYLERVRRWYAAVCPLIRTCAADHGGAIALVQIDNEVGGIHNWGQTLDYSEVGMGIGGTAGRYAAFLSARHGSVAHLNRCYGTAFGSCDEVRPADLQQSGIGGLSARRDYFDFYCQSLAEYLARLRDLLRENGITVPLCHNPANEKMSPFLLESARRLGAELLVGVDNYYCLGPHQGQNNPTPQYAVRTLLSLEMLRAMGFPPVVLEIPSGSYSDWPPVTPEDLRACYLLHLALGAKGHNYYIFSGGCNPTGQGLTGDVYDYNAPIGAAGEIRPSYPVLEEVGAFIRQQEWICESDLWSDFDIALDWDLARARYYWPGDVAAGTHSGSDVWEFVRDGVVTSALCAGLTPRLVALDAVGDLAPGRPLLVPCAGFMRASDQQALCEYMTRGGQVLFTPVLPHRDEFGEPCSLLAEALGVSATTQSEHWGTQRARLDVAGVDNVFFNGTLHPYGPCPEGAEPMGADTLTGRVVCWKKPFGKGAAMVLGLRWTHCKQEHAAMLASLLKGLGGNQRLCVSNPSLWGFVREAGGHRLLFLVNLTTSSMAGSVKVREAPVGPWRDLGTFTLGAMTVLPVVFDGPQAIV